MGTLLHDLPRYRVLNCRFGGIVIARKADGATLFLQPGDDAGYFLDRLEETNERYSYDDVCSEYDDGMEAPGAVA